MISKKKCEDVGRRILSLFFFLKSCCKNKIVPSTKKLSPANTIKKLAITSSIHRKRFFSVKLTEVLKQGNHINMEREEKSQWFFFLHYISGWKNSLKNSCQNQSQTLIGGLRKNCPGNRHRGHLKWEFLYASHWMCLSLCLCPETSLALQNQTSRVLS